MSRLTSLPTRDTVNHQFFLDPRQVTRDPAMNKTGRGDILNGWAINSKKINKIIADSENALKIRFRMWGSMIGAAAQKVVGKGP